MNSFLRAALCIGALGGGPLQLTTLPQAPEPRLDLTPAEIELYKSAQTLIDWTPRQIQHCPYLHKLQPAASQDELPMILARVGQTVTDQFHDFPKVACDEEISETRSEESGVEFVRDYTVVPGKSDTTVTRKLRYIILPWPNGDIPAFEEYRTDLNGNPLDSSILRGFVMTSSKYASIYLYFSPADQHDSRFRYLGTVATRDRECHVVGFAQVPEKARRVDLFHSTGATFSLLFQGLAWVDSGTFRILRITCWLLASRKDIGVNSQTTTVDFFPFQPSGPEKALWLPRDVMVMLDFRGTKVRNTHRYSHYMLFRVESTNKQAE